jgi:D-serine deaminase-like pyridoxal phosphate-dependent protein
MQTRSDSWHKLTNAGEVASPALLVYPGRIEENIHRMLEIAGAAERLRPHVKTHKLAELVKMQIALGITKFKCATVSEAEMTAACGARDVLLAYQPVGPNVARFVRLIKAFPNTKFSTIADDAETLRFLSAAASDAALQIEVFLDIDCGMHRSGVAPGPAATELYRLINKLPALNAGGLHAYDGHIHDRSPAERLKACETAFASVQALRIELANVADVQRHSNASGSLGRQGLPVVAGGTPTFPIHALRKDVECSPGTCILWDAGYASKLPDLPFLPAAVLLARVVSKPGGNRLCLDLGHKAVASENPHPRVEFLELPDAKAVMHSEEHLVIETARADQFAVGACLYGIPWHICPTVALHSEAIVVRNGQAQEQWSIFARGRKLTI